MSLPVAAIKALRPKQWIKNGLLWAALVFSQRYTDPEAIANVAIGTVCFCALASAGYLFNDLRDVAGDRKHPTKKNRPIASGALPVPAAWALMAALLVGGLVASFTLLPARFGHSALAYLAITLSYTQLFKHVVLLDVFLLAAGFLVRAVAGAEAIPVASSPWFLICTGFAALFIGLAKRKAELRLLQEDAIEHRAILEEYSELMLHQLISITTACTLISYALYTIESGHPRALMATIPVVGYAVLRFLYLVEQKDQGGSPTKMLWTDRPMQASVVLFVGLAAAALRWGTPLN